MAQNCPTYGHPTNVICHNCGMPGHISRNCQTLRQNIYGAQLAQGIQGPPEQARLNPIIPTEAGFNEEDQQNLEGTIVLFHSQVKALFNTGATRSFIAVRIV